MRSGRSRSTTRTATSSRSRNANGQQHHRPPNETARCRQLRRLRRRPPNCLPIMAELRRPLYHRAPRSSTDHGRSPPPRPPRPLVDPRAHGPGEDNRLLRTICGQVRVSPPSTTTIWPVANGVRASETTASAMSSASRRDPGVRATIASFASHPAVQGVSTSPGATAFTRTSEPAPAQGSREVMQRRLRDCVRERAPARDIPATEPTLMIAPFASRNAGTAARLRYQDPSGSRR